MVKFNLERLKSRVRIPRPRLPDRDSLRSRPFIISLGVVLAVFLAAIGYGLSYTSKPEFCANCHELKPQINSWQNISLHAEVDCAVCHYPGFFGFAKQKAQLIEDTYRHFTNSYEKPINRDSSLSKKVDNDACLGCHSPKREFTPKRGLRMNHEIHMEKGVNCTTCHNRAGHPELPQYKSFISMEGCFRCHGLSKTALAPGRCTACHTKEFDLIPETGNLSHKTGTWRVPDHGKIAKQDIGQCTMCHQKTYCKGCHGVDVPHPDKFVKKEHGQVGQQDPLLCQKCHREQDFCNACHHKGYTGPPGGWVPAHKAVVAQAGPAYCFNCHGPTFCASCHVRGEKQPRMERMTRD